MKKRITSILVLLLLLSSACAEDFNVSSMTDDELLNAYESIKLEMQNRGVSTGTERTLREGKYIIGHDIAAGNYIITCLSTAGDSAEDAYGALGSMMDALDDDDNNWGDLYGSLGGLLGDSIDMSVEIIGDYGDVLKSYNMKTGDSFTLQLEEGTALQISDGSCSIKAE